MRDGRRLPLLALGLIALLAPLAAPQEQESGEQQETAEQREVIRSYDSRIELHADGSMRVHETIRVVALGEQIRHGIYRDFPTDYRDKWGTRYHVKFEVVAAARDGRPEPWHSESLENGVRVYLGDKDVLVAHGEHTYELDYVTNRQAGFFADHDELYWNVTGNGWIFPIEAATAEVTLPHPVAREQVTITGYTGPQGSTAQDFSGEVDAQGATRFRTQHALEEYAGLTIVVMFPKGLVHEPTREERLRWFFEDNAAATVALIGLLLTFVYQFAAWSAVGRDPQAGTIVVRYAPPDGFSPAAVRDLRRMKYDDKCFAALVVDMAVKRYLRLKQESDDSFVLTREPKGDAKDLTDDEELLGTSLFESSDSIALKQTNHTKIKSAIDAVKERLARKLEQRYFVTNAKYLWPSIGLTLATLVAAVMFSGGEMRPVALFMMVWLSGWSVGVAVLSYAVASAWRQAWHAHGLGKLSYFGALFITAFAVPFFAGELFGLAMFARATSVVATLVLIVLAISNFIFHELLKAPTHMGRDLLDQIDGYREFLGATEDMARTYPIERNPATFEKHLPYAMALDLEEVWTKKFESVLAAATAAGAATRGGYSPAWATFAAGSGVAGLSSIGSLSGSLSSAISSSSTAPGSSSGGGGGGSSGGGGGGGGGGGW